LVPAALGGVDLDRLLEKALTEAENAEACNDPVQGDNRAARLGATLGELARGGRDKLTLVLSEPIASFADWVEQLVAESTGKEGQGILPVVGEPLAGPDHYGADRVFVHLRLEGDDSRDEALAALAEAGHPVITLSLRDPYDLGSQFFLWEMATAVAGWRLGIQPFDQPDVEAAKVQGRKVVAAYAAEGRIPEPAPDLTADGIAVYGARAGAASPAEALTAFLGAPVPGAYVAVQAYLPPTPETDQALAALRAAVRTRTGLAATVGYGPRFLHSTGQLHKGDAGKGLFLQLTADPPRDAGIPDEPGSLECALTFGVLERAQALGDGQALRDRGRRVLRLHLGADAPGAVGRLVAALG
jgi:hypothetical protein